MYYNFIRGTLTERRNANYSFATRQRTEFNFVDYVIMIRMTLLRLQIIKFLRFLARSWIYWSRV